MPSLDLFFRIGTIALLLLLATILIKEKPNQPSALLGAGLALSVAGMAMVAITLEWGWVFLEIPLNLICTTAPLFFWLLSKSLFEDSFRWKWWYVLPYALLAVTGIAGHYLSFGDFRGYVHWAMRSAVAHHGMGMMPFILVVTVLVALALYVALKDWRLDLVESRRRARMLSVLLGGLAMLWFTFFEFLSLGTPRSGLADTAVSGLFFLFSFGICARSLSLRRSHYPQQVAYAFPSETPESLEAEVGATGAAIINKLNHLMAEDKVFREENFTIRRLAEKLEIKEYVLRRLINGYLGHRNFHSYLNSYRIEEVTRQLTDPKTAHLPILSIALDNGYRSMSAFNKAFKEIKGMTPSEYRRQGKSDAGSGQ
jgi:AraC-like DNA-binding protein